MKKLLDFDEFVFLQPFVWKRKDYPIQCKRKHFFLSFTDSLVYIFHSIKLQKKDYILLPNFYCPDTIAILGRYGTVVFYEIEDNMMINKKSYFSQIEKYSPRITINYSFLGNSFTKHEIARIRSLSPSTLVIEDCAHRILDRQNLVYFSEYYFYIDSIRKYSPFLGSHLINPYFISDYKVTVFNRYKMKILFFQILIQFISYFALQWNLVFLNQLAYFIFDKQDAIVGTSFTPTLGDSLSYFLWGKMDIEKIKLQKKHIASVYFTRLHKKKIPYIKPIALTEDQLHELVYYPVLVDATIVDDLIDYLNERHIYASKLWDSPKQSFQPYNTYLFNSLIVLPLSSQIRKEDAVYITEEILKFLSES